MRARREFINEHHAMAASRTRGVFGVRIRYVAAVKEILAIPLIGVIPEDECVIVSTNRGEPLVLENKLSLPGLAFEHTACRLDGQDIEFLDLQLYSKGPLKRLRRFFLGSFIT